MIASGCVLIALGGAPAGQIMWCGLTSEMRGPVKGVAVPQSGKGLAV